MGGAGEGWRTCGRSEKGCCMYPGEMCWKLRAWRWLSLHSGQSRAEQGAATTRQTVFIRVRAALRARTKAITQWGRGAGAGEGSGKWGGAGGNGNAPQATWARRRGVRVEQLLPHCARRRLNWGTNWAFAVRCFLSCFGCFQAKKYYPTMARKKLGAAGRGNLKFKRDFTSEI